MERSISHIIPGVFFSACHMYKMEASRTQKLKNLDICKTIEGRVDRLIRTAQKMKFSINNFSSKCDQIRRKLQIWSHLLTKSLVENFIFCAVTEDRVMYLFSSKKTCVKESRFFENSHFCVQMKSSYYSDGKHTSWDWGKACLFQTKTVKPLNKEE